MLNDCRLKAVRLRLDGYTVADTAARTGLSAPTVSAAWKAFREGGWAAVPVRSRGRKTGQATRLDATAQLALVGRLKEHPQSAAPAWSSRALAEALHQQGHKLSTRTIDHWLEARDLKPQRLALDALGRHNNQHGRWYRQQVKPMLEEVHKAEGSVWQGGVRVAKSTDDPPDLPRYQLYLHGKRSVLLSRCFTAPLTVDDYLALFQRLLDQNPGKPVALVFHGAYFKAAPGIGRWLEQHPALRLLPYPVEQTSRASYAST